MQVRWRQITATMAALVMLGILSPAITSAQPGNSNSNKSKQLVLLHATPGTYNGPCPGEITFTGTIHGAPGDTVIVVWSDSDSSTYDADTIVLDSRGKGSVEMTMSVGSEGDTTWSQGSVELTATWGDGTSRTSKPASYRVKCNENSNRNHDRDSTDDDDDDSSNVSVSVSPDEYEGPCPAEITFTGMISGNPGDTVTVDWNRSDSATGTPETVVLDSTGSATVTTTWTLGGNGSEIEGWQSLTVTFPDGTTETSDQAEFSVDCDDSTDSDSSNVSVTVSPEEYEGPCPTELTFTGMISGNPGDTVTVDWNRSDSATGTPETVVLDSTGSATVTTTWTLGGNGSEIEGWQSLTVTFPDGTTETSDQAEFSIDCDDSTENGDDTDTTDSEDGAMGISIHANPGAWVGPCPGTITFTAMVRGNPGDTVTINWNRSDSATGTSETVVLDEDGKATVTTTWTLGGDDLPEYEGWVSLTATYPDGTEMTSRQAKFKVKCKDNGRVDPATRRPSPDIE